MQKNYLTDVLNEVLDEEHLAFALKIDDYLRQRWENASDDLKEILQTFEARPSDNSMAEFALYLTITEAMLQESVQ